MAVNGSLPDTLLAGIGGGHRLELGAAVSWASLCADVRAQFGWTPEPSPGWTAYRSRAEQERIFRDNYSADYAEGDHVHSKFWNGVWWWRRPGRADAAIPGTSNHGFGIAVDVAGLGGFGGTRFGQFAKVAGRHGWTNTQGRAIGEPWHWVKTGPDTDQPATPPAEPEAEPQAEPQEDRMLTIARTPADPTVWIGDGVTRRRIATQDTLAGVQWLIAQGILGPAYQAGAVQEIPDLWTLGHPIDASEAALEQRLTAAIAGVDGGTTALDPTATAAAIATALGPELAAQVAAELAKRLRS